MNESKNRIPSKNIKLMMLQKKDNLCHQSAYHNNSHNKYYTIYTIQIKHYKRESLVGLVLHIIHLCFVSQKEVLTAGMLSDWIIFIFYFILKSKK